MTQLSIPYVFDKLKVVGTGRLRLCLIMKLNLCRNCYKCGASVTSLSLHISPCVWGALGLTTIFVISFVDFTLSEHPAMCKSHDYRTFGDRTWASVRKVLADAAGQGRPCVESREQLIAATTGFPLSFLPQWFRNLCPHQQGEVVE